MLIPWSRSFWCNMIDPLYFSQISLEHSLSGTIFYELESFQILFVNRLAKSHFSSETDPTPIGQSLTRYLQDTGNLDFLKTDLYYGEVTFSSSVNDFLPALVSVRIVNKDGFKMGVLSFQDLSPQKKMLRELMNKQEGLTEILEELTRKNVDLEALDKAKTKFLSLVTHELRTPLNTIVATSEILYGQIYQTEEEFKDLSRNLYLQSQHMLELVNDILDMTKLHSGKMEFYIDQGNLADILDLQKQFFTDMAREKNVEIVFEKPAQPALCYFDDVRLKQVVSNLLSNAVKFNKQDGRIVMTISEQPEFVEFSICDTGIGIPADKLDSVFNEFETIKNISNHHKGTGLGLPIVKSLVQGMGGEIRLKSIFGEGSVFYVTLPKGKILAPELYQTRIDEGFTLFDDSEDESA